MNKKINPINIIGHVFITKQRLSGPEGLMYICNPRKSTQVKEKMIAAFHPHLAPWYNWHKYAV